jgi:hypothetical protein
MIFLRPNRTVRTSAAALSDQIAPADRDADISAVEQNPPGSNCHHPLTEPILPSPNPLILGAQRRTQIKL